MRIAKTFNACCLILTTCLVLSACAARPALKTKSAVVPVGVDFSGRWQLRLDSGAKAAPRVGADPGILMPPRNSRRVSGRQTARGAQATAVGVFIENGESLKISQTVEGLFISFDRAVVEEYTFGENRTVSVGPIEAQRVSGWQDRSFVIETLDDDGAILTESWHLEASGNVLVRELAITKGETKKFSTRQLFERT